MESNQKETKEIDLIELFRLIGSGIKNLFVGLFKSILFLIVFGVRRIHFLIVFAIAGALVGLLFFSATQRYYSSNLIAQPNGISAEEMVTYINDLTTFCKKRNTPALSLALDLNDSVSKQIKSIEAFQYIDINGDGFGDMVDFNHTYNAKDTNQHIDEHRIYVKVDVFTNSAFINVRNGIFTYIARNPYLLKLNDIRKNELTELIHSSESEIKKLDSLQDVDYFKDSYHLSARDENKIMFLSEKDKQMYYRDKMALINQKQKYQKELELATEPITIIKDFTQLSVEENPRGKYLFQSGLLFFILGYFTLLFIKYIKQILAYFDKV